MLMNRLPKHPQLLLWKQSASGCSSGSRKITHLAGVIIAIAILPFLSIGGIFSPYPGNAQNPRGSGQAMTVRSDIQEADANTGIVTARGNVQIDYPARQIQATAAQAQYFSQERRIILSGNVLVLQNGNTIRGETVTYLIDEGRFIATPRQGGQVESIYLLPDNQNNAAAQPFNPAPPFQTPLGSP
ncbi:hypothetical protein N39L_31390 [Limnospira platensis NIES-39]|uniref:Organic solvent tolerance-like N-terminal domain-containing protein n=2 Tax=Oscillatoriophycideae TaxID=1301283 RepID=A0A5M3TBE0_LIMPL|nr:hypothetical protein NIES39_J00340 [Arthrospira platensis NIES-39]BDT13416.1 hypothetical protein N39L_31390 [Arthrospira platensis NIES-39]GCE95982.1 hypothetical protein NIES46_40490 [Arthrospira platensis NIES-46]